MENSALYNERELMNLVATGCEHSFTTLFNHHRTRIYSVAFRLLQCPLASEEVVHDVFLQIWLKRQHLPAINNFTVYLFVVTRNHCFKAVKQMASLYLKSHLSEDESLIVEEDILHKIGEKEYRQLLENGVDQLPQQQEKVFRLIMEEGLQRRQVADLLRLKPETIKYHLAEAMKNLRAFCSLHIDHFLLIAPFLFAHKK